MATRLPTGSGNKNATSLKVLDYKTDCLVKRSIITIKNKDDLCCGRAIAVGQAIADRHPKLMQFKAGRLIQKSAALDLYKKANVLAGPCGLPQINKFQGVLRDYQIIVIDFNARNTVIYEGPRQSKRIVLYKKQNHYNVINPEKLPAFYGKRFYCQKCKSYFHDYFSHPCLSPCNTCYRKDCVTVSTEKHTCPDCSKICRSISCFNSHKKARKSKGVDLPSNCQKTFRCETCSVIVDKQRENEHCCGEYRCHICKSYVSCDHLCYICNRRNRNQLTTTLFSMTLKLTFRQGNTL